MSKKRVLPVTPFRQIVIPDIVPPYHKLWGINSVTLANGKVHISQRDVEPMRPFYLDHVLEVAVKHGYKSISFWYLAPDDMHVIGEDIPISMFVR